MQATTPGFCEGIQYFSQGLLEFKRLSTPACLSNKISATVNPEDVASIYKMLFVAALRFLTAHSTAAKSSRQDFITSKGVSVVGQIIPACTSILTPAHPKFPALPVAVFPGNLGDQAGITTAYRRLGGS